MGTKNTTPLDLLKTILIIGAVISMAVGAATWSYQVMQLVATKEFHQQDQQEMMQQIMPKLNILEENSTVERINKIFEAKCDTGTTGLDKVLKDLLVSYEDIAGRRYSVGPCKDGHNPQIPPGAPVD